MTSRTRRQLLEQAFLTMFSVGLPVTACASHTLRITHDVIVVGAGIAGLTAGLRALLSGARSVIVLEKTPIIGGAACLSTGFVTYPKSVAHVSSFAQTVYRDTPYTVCHSLLQAVSWLKTNSPYWKTNSVTADTIAIREQIDTISLIQGLRDLFLELGGSIVTGAQVTKLLVDHNHVINGVRVRLAGSNELHIARRGLILATGGYGSKISQLSHRQFGHPVSTMAFTGAQGDGIILARIAGAITEAPNQELMDFPYIVSTSSLRERVDLEKYGAFYISDDAKENISDASKHDLILHYLNGHNLYLLFDDAVRIKACREDSQANLFWQRRLKEIGKSPLIQANSWNELASRIGVPVHNIHTASNRNRKQERQGNKAPLYALAVQPIVYATTAGVKVDPFGQVVSSNGSPLSGLWAAGEVIGFRHSSDQPIGTLLSNALGSGWLAAEQIMSRKPS